MIMFGARKCLGVDIGGKDIKVVELRKVGKKYEVVQASRIPLRNGNGGEDVATALGHFLLETDTYAANAVCSLPANACSVKFAEVPNAKPTDLMRMVRFEAESQMPLPLDELVWNYVVEGDNTDAKRHIVMAGARRSLVEETLALMDAAHALTMGVMVSSLAAAEGMASSASDDGPTLVVDIGSEWMDMLLIDKGSVYATHSVRLGCEDLTEAFGLDFKVDAEEAERLKQRMGIGLNVKAAAQEGGSTASYVESWVDAAAQEIHRFGVSLSMVGSEPRPERVALVGDASGLPGIADALSRRAGLSVEVGDPWQGMLVSEVCVHTAQEPAAVFAVATGLAMAGLGRKPVVDLMPRRIAEERALRRKELTVLTSLGAAALLLLIVLIAGAPGLRAKSAELRSLRDRIAHVRRDTRSRGPSLHAQAKALNDAVKAIGSNDASPLELLRRLSENLPRSVWLTELSMEPGKAAVLKGGAASNSSVADTVDILTELDAFKSITLDYTNLAAGDGSQGYEFQITCAMPRLASVAGLLPMTGGAKGQGAGVRTRVTVQ